MLKQKIFIIEDDKKIANIVSSYLKHEGVEVFHFINGKEALDAVIELNPDLIILDLMLPDISGEELCQDIKEMVDIPIIMLTAKSSEEEKLAGFALGADDYVTKPFSPRELIYRVKAILKRVRKSSSEKLSFNNGELILDSSKYEALLNGKNLNLTPTEFKILLVLAEKPEKVFSRYDIIEQALGYQFDGYDRNVDAHIKNIRAKMSKLSEDAKYIVTVYGVGYKFVGVRDK
ncbi:two-component system, OmpR family, response regulator [Deferribacter desulfuricans SSM1]|uniref:Two-component system, OmpR family, response regulator n=1 Tax=Deferribacter desulfuricans (strain DSM 14783 / JCM 11476 / NBRC 101012 / SSM1) TaxID=639282 RepID=D3PB25_DEFDS|nr:response regulator transcription factor [Deferribacter desulfuricans]BAI79798.1 two-component system, OmpR family, response regulator [Deferribacter desulfuricans SSM1]